VTVSLHATQQHPLIDTALERLLVACVVQDSDNADRLHASFGLDVLADFQAQAVWRAFANLCDRGERIGLEEVGAEVLARSTTPDNPQPDITWLWELLSLDVRGIDPIEASARLVDLARERQRAIERESERMFDEEAEIDEFALRDVDFDSSSPTPTNRARSARPEVTIRIDRHRTLDDAELALSRIRTIYVRGQRLVRIVKDRGTPDWLTRPEGTPTIVPLDRDSLLELLGRAASWMSRTRGEEPRRTTPPAWASTMLLARGEWNLPQIEAISDAPVFRADGTIQGKPGYDPDTRVVFEPGSTAFPDVPIAPTLAQAQDALRALTDPFSEFPFVSPSDRSAVVAFILSVVARPAISGSVPMFVAQATTPGSGKGLLIDTAAMIATGRRAPLMAPTDDDEETRKRLFAVATESPSIVVIDNVEGSFGSPALAMALTAGEVRERVLGSSKMATASLRPVWAITGNNVQLKGDLGRRVVPIDLDPGVEHPEDRTFERPDILAHVRANRPLLVTSALTILRAYTVAGRPAHGLPQKGSFEQWDRLVRGAIIWAGGADPLGGIQRIRDQSDADIDQLRALLVAWHDMFGGTSVSVADAIKRAGDSGDLREALAAYCRSGKPDARALGYVFRKVRGRVVANLTFRRQSADRDGTAKWTVEQVGKQPSLSLSRADQTFNGETIQ
jgi:hypothetical protein